MTDPYTFPLIEQPLAPPSPEEMARRIHRAHALRQWHTDREIKLDFETYFRSLEGPAA